MRGVILGITGATATIVVAPVIPAMPQAAVMQGNSDFGTDRMARAMLGATGCAWSLETALAIMKGRFCSERSGTWVRL